MCMKWIYWYKSTWWCIFLSYMCSLVTMSDLLGWHDFDTMSTLKPILWKMKKQYYEKCIFRSEYRFFFPPESISVFSCESESRSHICCCSQQRVTWEEQLPSLAHLHTVSLDHGRCCLSSGLGRQQCACVIKRHCQHCVMYKGYQAYVVTFRPWGVLLFSFICLKLLQRE